MLYLDTCVLLALLTPEVHSPAASAFLEQAADTLAISPWSATELHSRSLPDGAPSCAAWMPPSFTQPSSWGLLPC